MSFKCSVFGHAYGDSEVEREREEEGSEVVTTIRETQTCKRCGEMRVVSENKEVTTLETAADIVAGDLSEETAEASAGDPPAEPADGAGDAGAGQEPEQPAEAIDPSSEAAVKGTIPDTETGGEVTTAPDNTGTAPDSSTGTAPDPAETDPETDDGVILEDDEETDDTAERAPGEWPEEPDDGDDEWQPDTEVDPTPEDDPTVEPTGSAVTVPEGEFHCPDCGFHTPVEESSLRRGDFCPECHRGSLEHVAESN